MRNIYHRLVLIALFLLPLSSFASDGTLTWHYVLRSDDVDFNYGFGIAQGPSPIYRSPFELATGSFTGTATSVTMTLGIDATPCSGTCTTPMQLIMYDSPFANHELWANQGTSTVVSNSVSFSGGTAIFTLNRALNPNTTYYFAVKNVNEGLTQSNYFKFDSTSFFDWDIATSSATTTLATSTRIEQSLGSLNFGLAILIVLISLGGIFSIYNLITKKRKPWQR